MKTNREDEELFNSLDEIISPNIDDRWHCDFLSGKINSKNGIAHTARAFRRICDLVLKSILEEKYSKPVWILMNHLCDYPNKCYYDKELDLGIWFQLIKKFKREKIETNKTT